MAFREKLRRFIYRNKGLNKLFDATIQKARIVGWQKELKANGWDILKRIHAALEPSGGAYFLDSGTLLGMIREGHFISHDTDIDMGVILDDHFTAADLDRAMLIAGLKKHHTFFYHGEPAEISYTYGSIVVDFFRYFHTDRDTWYLQYCFFRDVWKEYPREDMFEVNEATCHITGVKKIDANGMELSVPQNAEEYLASIYTEDWRTPNPNWNSKNAPRIRLLEGEYGFRK